jgi:hypothetical protein
VDTSAATAGPWADGARPPCGPRSELPHRGPHGRRAGGLPPDFADYCRQVLASVPRADQRRWGELYVRGLLTVPGRKTITRLADPPADQSLQQFVNQSPWDWRPVRRDLAAAVGRVIGAQALVVLPVFFPKTGDRSVGVARQYVPARRRTVHGQAAVSAWLAGPEASCPVDWDLVLPPRWVQDPRLRSRAGIPADAVARRPSDATADLLTDLPRRLGVPPLPAVLDLRNGSPLRILELLRAQRIPYLARVDAGTLLRRPGARGAVGTGRPLPAAAVAASDLRTEAVSWPGVDRQPRMVQVTAVPVLPARRTPLGGTGPTGPPLLLLAERTRADRHPHRYTLTDMVNLPVADLVRLGTLGQRVDADHDALVDERGLTDFEGRSYRGWHHHVTLVSVAHGYDAVRSASGSGWAEIPDRAGSQIAHGRTGRLDP